MPIDPYSRLKTKGEVKKKKKKKKILADLPTFFQNKGELENKTFFLGLREI